MNLLTLIATATACVFLGRTDEACILSSPTATQAVEGPHFTGTSLDVVISADSYLVWDIGSGELLKSYQADQRRPVASLSKLATVLVVKSLLPPGTVVEIPSDALRAQRLGANVKLPVGEHAYVSELLAASLIPSANDAAVTLAVAAKGSEEEFAQYVNESLATQGILNTHVVNATGLQSGEQYSTALDIKNLFMKVYMDPLMGPYLSQQQGIITTTEGTIRSYVTTNKLLGSYMPVLAAKTGYTTEAKENLALITRGSTGQRLGVVILGSDDRFQDMKALVEWVWRNYTW